MEVLVLSPCHHGTNETLFLCSNIPILLWYPEEDTEEREALFKRINCVLDFQDYKKKSMCRNNDYLVESAKLVIKAEKREIMAQLC